MKYILLTILFLNSVARAQDYVANWSTLGKEVGIVNFQVQKSSNNISWTTIATITPKRGKDTNRYEYTIPTADNYIRIKALMSINIIYTVPIKVKNTNVVISNMKVKYNNGSDNLSFTAIHELAVSYYSIEKSSNGSTNWTVAGKLMQTDKENYVLNIYGDSRKYRLIAVYKNGIKSAYLYFN